MLRSVRFEIHSSSRSRAFICYIHSVLAWTGVQSYFFLYCLEVEKKKVLLRLLVVFPNPPSLLFQSSIHIHSTNSTSEVISTDWKCPGGISLPSLYLSIYNVIYWWAKRYQRTRNRRLLLYHCRQKEPWERGWHQIVSHLRRFSSHRDRATLELQNPSYDVFELDKIGRSPDL